MTDPHDTRKVQIEDSMIDAAQEKAVMERLGEVASAVYFCQPAKFQWPKEHWAAVAQAVISAARKEGVL